MWWPTKDKMTMGLDIQGGLHLVLKVDVDGALKQDATRVMSTIRTDLEREKVQVKDIAMNDALRGDMTVVLTSKDEAEKAEKRVTDYFGNTFNVSRKSDTELALAFSELFVREFKKSTIDRAIETIRNRIDEFGVSEPSITAQGESHILVQLPGIQDAANAKELINKTARLDFIIVDEEFPQEKLVALVAEAEKTGNLKFAELKYSAYVDKLNEALKGKIPAGTVVLFEKPENAESMEVDRLPYLLVSSESVSGDLLTDAFVAPGEQGKPVVSFRMDAQGGKLMGDMTQKHKGKRMAIVLDKVVKSAPVIQSRISDSGQITLGRGGYDQVLKDAKVLAITLKSGALPAALEQQEERTVGPSVGADAIKKGQMGAFVGGLIVFVFMIIYYRSFGVLACLALSLNLVMTFAILSALNATLTLPGVAGLALGLGISVDASVIIFERIKEEMDRGLGLAAAIREGYDRAFSSIFDSNVTSVAVCIVLMYFGTGPVRGFAVTLLTGLVITLFTAVFFTRAILDLLVNRLKLTPSIRW
ncbi:MAG: protein translocase subunit SecD [Bdellovibrionaceae bacterium]|nr:protein translocase subunit SecD [Pseudobdellovibrionaceae bacterium]